MAELVTIAVDVMGGDNAPQAVLDGIERVLAENPDIQVIACGLPEGGEPFAAAHERCKAQAASEVIAMDEHPANAVRRKKDSSIVVGCRLVKEGAAQGFFSAGSTGACLSAATLVVGRIKGIKRPALGQILPAYERPTLLLDVGANADCKPDYLVQFGLMGSVFMRQLMGVAAPRVGLLNIGEEEEKGSEFAVECHRQMKAALPGFSGNAEGRDVLTGHFDVVVTDGFTGNVVLKTVEGASKTLFRYIKDVFMASPKTKVGALLVKADLAEVKTKLSPDTYGGAPLLGVKGAVLVGHGSSGALAVANGIAKAAETVRADVAGVIAATLAEEAVQ